MDERCGSSAAQDDRAIRREKNSKEANSTPATPNAEPYQNSQAHATPIFAGIFPADRPSRCASQAARRCLILRLLPLRPVAGVPQMGWNQITIPRRPPILEGINEGTHFYFVHSYYVVPKDEGVIAAETEYGGPFCSMIWRGNLFATQFHPEKSQAEGLKILKSFAELV